MPVKKFFYDPLGSGRAAVDTVVSLTGFALVGGPARQVGGAGRTGAQALQAWVWWLRGLRLRLWGGPALFRGSCGAAAASGAL